MPTAQVRFEIIDHGHLDDARVDEFDNIFGEKVPMLVDEVRPAGYQKTDWYGRNQRGDMVASGVYFIRMKTTDSHRELRFCDV